MVSAAPSDARPAYADRGSAGPRLDHRPLFRSSLLQIDEVVAHAGSERPSAERELDRHGLVLPYRGIFATHSSQRHSVLASTGHAVLLAARIPYRYSYPGAVGDHCLALAWSDEVLERMGLQALHRGHFGLPQSAVAPVLEPAQLLARERLRLRLAGGDTDPIAIEEQAVELLAAVLRAARGEAEDGRSFREVAASRNHARIERLKELVASAPTRRWTLDTLAAAVCVSPYHLAHLFKLRVGLSVYEYVLRARLAVALQRVLETGADLTTIGLDTGFSSHSHFTAQFRARFGITPLALRGQCRRHPGPQLSRIATADPALAS